ncbi:MAG: phage protease [Sodalis sp. (in: enterobacteria)]|uniref:phage protease n=1 Tax=Sodalis sp. (in: enterobacteria) TaxID=1898979 RepID=UPI003F3A062A
MNAALTNVPALDGMVALLAATSQQLTGENNVDELLEQLHWMLNLPLSATPEEMTVELKKLIDRLSGGQGTAAARINLLSLLGEKDNQIAALSQQTSTPPDPATYAPVSVANELREHLATHQPIAALSRLQTGGNASAGCRGAAIAPGRALDVPALAGESTPDVGLFQHYGLTSAGRHHGGGVAGGRPYPP